MRRVSTGVFWVSAGAVLATYVGFPLVTLGRARFRPRPVRDGAGTPRVAVVIAAHNEEAGIARKLRSVLACDYPADLLQVVVASDGSTDRTVAEASSVADDRVRVLDLPRTGKAGALNAAVGTCDADVLVLSDANNPLDPQALRAIVRPFSDPEVGGVAGDQRYVVEGESAETSGERSYWAVDRLVKVAESAAGSVVSATGALYAVRRELFPSVREGVTDDFWVSTNVVASGHRLVQSLDAVVFEEPAAESRLEFARKVRVMSRGFRGVYERRELLDARRFGFYSVQLLCHKVLRRLVVVPLVLMWVASLARAARGGRWWRLLAAAQTSGYAAGALGLRWTPGGPLGKVLALGGYFLMINAASAVAAWNVLRGRRIVVWEPARPGEPR